jgi:hypothetical protein
MLALLRSVADDSMLPSFYLHIVDFNCLSRSDNIVTRLTLVNNEWNLEFEVLAAMAMEGTPLYSLQTSCCSLALFVL